MDLTEVVPKAETVPDDGTSELAIMDPEHGDMKVSWNRFDKEEVEGARRTFDAMKAKGYAAYKMEKNGTKGQQIFGFDEKAESILMAPPLQGG